MILYLASSTLCMGILLLFYHLVLENEKMHFINRGYLMFSLLFSLIIPFIPVGMTEGLFSWFQYTQGSELTAYTSLSRGEALDGVIQEPGIVFPSIVQIAFLIYTVVAGALFVRLLRIVYMIQMKADRNPTKVLDHHEVVLLSEQVIPHTFISTIFLNREQYLKGEIPEEVLVHELTHAKQKHSIDILFVEFLKIVFWFNPILYFYKKAILLNHEFLADEAVISRGTQISEYQTLLLKSLDKYPSPGLISPFSSYKTTKKRVLMMLQTKSRIRSIIKITSLIPLFISLALFLGCEYTPSEYSEQEKNVKELTVEISDPETFKVNGNEMDLAEFEEYLSGRTEPPERVDVEVDSNPTRGLVSDLQELLRAHEILKVNYSTSNVEKKREELDRITDMYIEAAGIYMDMSLENTDFDVLWKEYDEVIIKYKAILNIGIRIPGAQPAPPRVPSPEKRLEYEANIQNPNLPPPSPPVEKETS